MSISGSLYKLASFPGHSSWEWPGNEATYRLG